MAQENAAVIAAQRKDFLEPGEFWADSLPCTGLVRVSNRAEQEN
jgi:hypothetical protein